MALFDNPFAVGVITTLTSVTSSPTGTSPPGIVRSVPSGKIVKERCFPNDDEDDSYEVVEEYD